MSDPSWTILQGHALDLLPTLPAASAQCVVTSPPYWGLRDYGLPPLVWDDPGGCKHWWVEESGFKNSTKGNEGSTLIGPSRAVTEGRFDSVHAFCANCPAWRGSLGLEPTPDLYVSHLVKVFREVRRVLRDNGTVWLNMGDVYGSGTRVSRDYSPNVKHGYWSNPAITQRIPTPAKQLIGLHWRLAFALQADGWYLRSDIIWAKPNPMPESVTDRPTKSHEYVFLLSKSASYYYDAEAIREPNQGPLPWGGRATSKADDERGQGHHGNSSLLRPGQTKEDKLKWYTSGRNRRSVWIIPTEPYPDAHFATFPKALVEPCILAGTSEKGCCPACGAPWERVMERTGHISKREPAHQPGNTPTKVDSTGWAPTSMDSGRWRQTCACGAPDGIKPDDLEIVNSPLGGGGMDEDPTIMTGRKGLNRPRAEDEGQRPMTRYEQRQYAAQLRQSPHRSTLMESDAGKAFAHYVRTDASGARPIPDGLLEAWIKRGWLARVTVPTWEPPPTRPCVVLDPFSGSGTVGVVALRHGRSFIGIDLSEPYVTMARERIRQDATLLNALAETLDA